jgi:hypothetical protein
MNAPPTGTPGPRFVVGTLGRGLLWDVGLPLVTYYALHLLGFDNWVALLGATFAAGARVLLVAIRDRALNAFAMLMMIVFGLGLGLAFLTGDPRFLLAKDSITTALVGISFLVTAALGHPLTLAAARTWAPDRAAELAEHYRTDPTARRWHVKVSVVWGAGLLAEAAIRVGLVYLLPIEVAVGVSAALMITVFGSLILWTAWDLKRRQQARALQGSR